MLKIIIVTGAAGFAGCNLLEALLEKGYFVYAVARPNSPRNSRLQVSEQLKLVPCDMMDYGRLPDMIQESCDIFYHLAWQGKRSDFMEQCKNIKASLIALDSAVKLGCKRFVCTGSQAEYGPQTELITEETCPHPVTAYGAAKLAACALTRQKAAELGIDWIWGRIFSLYGKYEPHGRMLPDLILALKEDKDFHMTSATQNWDYLYSSDGAEALIALGERGNSGEIYNIANGNYRPLREFTEELRQEIPSKGRIIYGKPLDGATSLQASVDKIRRDTGWKAKIGFREGLRLMIKQQS